MYFFLQIFFLMGCCMYYLFFNECVFVSYYFVICSFVCCYIQPVISKGDSWVRYIFYCFLTEYFVSFMQPSMGTLNSPSSRVVKDSKPSRRRILRCINFGIGESSPNLFLNMVNLNLVKFEAPRILNKRVFYCLIVLFIWKWILT